MKKLERSEMKNLKGGVVPPPPSYGSTCVCTNSSCSNQGEQFYCEGESGGYGGCAWMAMTHYCVGSGCGASCWNLS